MMRQCARNIFVSLMSLVSLMIFFAAATSELHAEEKGPLGKYHFALKSGSFNTIEESAFGHGIYFALEGYGEIKPNIYVGGEIGFGASMFVGDFQPLELNAKYAIEPVSNLVFDVGTGISAVKVSLARVLSTDIDEWLFGGQFFTGISYKVKWFYFGLDGKIQLTQNFDDRDYGFSNFRIGLKAGILF